MKIKNKTCYFCLIVGIVFVIFPVFLFVKTDKNVEFFVFSMILIGVILLKWYANSISKPHILKIKNKYLVFDIKKYKFEKIEFRLKYNGEFILVKLYLKDEKLELLLDAEEFDRFLYIVKPYLKNPKIAENINFKEIKLFKGGFFIKHKKFFYEKIQRLEIYKKQEYRLTFLMFRIFYDNQIFEKRVFYSEENKQKIVFIALNIKKPLSFKYLMIFSK